MGSKYSFSNDNNVINMNDYKEVKSRYFNIVNQILRKNYENCSEEERIRKNMKNCLDKKSFNDIYEIDEIENLPYIHWLDYLYNYLFNQEGEEWATEMILKLDKEQFLTENKYLSQFFFKEFLIKTEPNCIKESKDDEINNESNDEFFNNSKDLRISFNDNKLNMMRNLGGTFGPNSPQTGIDTNEYTENIKEIDADKKYKTFRNIVKKYIYIFKQHIVYKDHPINIVIQIFEQTWVKYVEKKLKLMENFEDENNNNTNSIVDNFTKQLQNFVIIVQNCLKLFYCKAIDYSCFDNEKDELINLLTTLVFRTGEIYNTIFKLQKIKLSSVVSDMENKYFHLKKITPQILGIEKQFCLNVETLNLQEEILEKEKLKLLGEENSNKNEQKEKEKKEEEINDKKINLDSNFKGTGNIYLDIEEEDDEKEKIEKLLIKIRNKKSKMLKYKKQEMDDIKVEIDFDHDNNNILENSFINKFGSTNDENYVGTILPKSRNSMNIDLATSSRNTINNNNKNNLIIYDSIRNDNDDDENCLIIREDNEGRKTLSPNIFVKVFDRISFIKNPETNISYYFPYETAIQLLRQIEKYKAPFEKMLIFASLGNEIKNCIDDFWKDMEDYIKNDLLGIEAEQLMTIFIYIISKAQIKDILVHCKLIKLFTTSMTKSSMIGYYYSNAEASVTYIQTIKNVKELFKGNMGIFDRNNSDNFNDIVDLY